MKRLRPWLWLSIALCVGFLSWLYWPRTGILRWPPVPVRLKLTRPHGMAPQAFKAFVKACYRAKIHPWRIGQTIGDHPLSVGYHKKDGVVQWKGNSFDYTTAVDVGTSDLNDYQIKVFLEALAQQGFAAFYRHEGKWKGREHIHAIYVLLPMKKQLRRQVRQFLRERRVARKKPPPWARQWKH
ncbi:MAG TPA: hypothetical protein VGB77_00390 [Abditibacteriaceae bacterium]